MFPKRERFRKRERDFEKTSTPPLWTRFCASKNYTRRERKEKRGKGKAKRERERTRRAREESRRKDLHRELVQLQHHYVIPCYYYYYTTVSFLKTLIMSIYTPRARARGERTISRVREESRARFIRRSRSSSSSPLSLCLLLQTATFSRTPLLRSPSNSRRSRLTPTLDGSRSPRPNPPSLSRFPRLVRIVCTRLPI